MSVSFSPDGQVASGSADFSIQTFDPITGSSGKPCLGHEEAIKSVVFSPDGKRLASGSLDSTVRVWDVETGKQLGLPLQGHTGGVCSVAFSPDGKWIVSGSSDCTIRIWDVSA
jgi:WD40 repeat protein